MSLIGDGCVQSKLVPVRQVSVCKQP